MSVDGEDQIRRLIGDLLRASEELQGKLETAWDLLDSRTGMAARNGGPIQYLAFDAPRRSRVRVTIDRDVISFQQSRAEVLLIVALRSRSPDGYARPDQIVEDIALRRASPPSPRAVGGYICDLRRTLRVVRADDPIHGSSKDGWRLELDSAALIEDRLSRKNPA